MASEKAAFFPRYTNDSITICRHCLVWGSYSYMEHIVSKWDEMGVLKRVLEKKLIFIETKVIKSLGFPMYFFNAGVLCFPPLPIYVDWLIGGLLMKVEESLPFFRYFY